LYRYALVANGGRKQAEMSPYLELMRTKVGRLFT
jgi:hypothetical protein